MSSVDDLMALVRELSSARWSAGVSAGNFDKIGERVASKEADELEAEIRSLAASMAQPKGWKLVPIEPTREMLRAVTAVVPKGPYDFAVVATWRAMLEAAPPPPLSASPEDKQ